MFNNQGLLFGNAHKINTNKKITFMLSIKEMKMKNLGLIIIVFLLGSKTSQSQCVRDTLNIFKFTDNQIDYEVIKENKTWAAAQACAVARGGQLVRIDSLEEQDSIFANLNRAGIVTANTIAPDGGGAAYVWLAGNDTLTEGDWVWDNPIGLNAQFWLGARSGSAVGNLYNNWGNEPDDFQGQDALGIALTAWPFGVAGEWNDVDENDTLYYIIEYPRSTGIRDEITKEQGFTIYPNPAQDILKLKCQCKFNEAVNYQVIDVKGAVVLSGSYISEIKIGQLNKGMYWLKMDGFGAMVSFQKY